MKPRKTGDTYAITGTLKGLNLTTGRMEAFNLTGFTVTASIVDRPSRDPLVTNAAVTVTDAVNGRFSFSNAVLGTAARGSYDLELKAVAGPLVYHFSSDGYEPLEIQQALG